MTNLAANYYRYGTCLSSITPSFAYVASIHQDKVPKDANFLYPLGFDFVID